MLRLAPLLVLVACSAEPATIASPEPAPALGWPQLGKGLPNNYAELQTLMPPGHELAHVPGWTEEGNGGLARFKGDAFADTVRLDFDGNGKPDLMFVMESVATHDRTLVVFMQADDGQLTRSLEVHSLLFPAGDLRRDGERLIVDQAFFRGDRGRRLTQHVIAYRDGDFYIVGYSHVNLDHVSDLVDYDWRGYDLDLVAGTGTAYNGPRWVADRPMAFTPKPLVKVRDYTTKTMLDDVLSPSLRVVVER